jgi:hypothetical protein
MKMSHPSTPRNRPIIAKEPQRPQKKPRTIDLEQLRKQREAAKKECWNVCFHTTSLLAGHISKIDTTRKQLFH